MEEESHVPGFMPTEEPYLMVRKARSGALSPYATKVATQMFVWLCSTVVWGATVDLSTHTRRCSGVCIYVLVVGVGAELFLTWILFFNLLVFMRKISRKGWFSHRFEMQMMLLVTLWWTCGVGAVCSVDQVNNGIETTVTSGVGLVASWLAFFGSIFGTYKAYQSLKEDEAQWDLSGYESPSSDDVEEPLNPVEDPSA